MDPEALEKELAELLRQRLISLLEEGGIDGDLVQAVAGETMALDRVLRDPDDARQRVDLLMELRRSGGLEALQAVVQRAARLAEKGDLNPAVLSAAGVVDPTLFTSPSEGAMLDVLRRLEPFATGTAPDRYSQLAKGLSESSTTLAAFFDGEQSVMVMCDEPRVRSNRLNLLGVLRNQAWVLGDFSRIAG